MNRSIMWMWFLALITATALGAQSDKDDATRGHPRRSETSVPSSGKKLTPQSIH